MPCVQPNAGNVAAGADLSASFAGSPNCSFKALSVESQEPINETLQLSTFGSFALKVGCNGSANEVIISNVITVACGVDLRLSGGRCVPTNTTCIPDEVRIGTRCKQRPQLRLQSDAEAIFDTVPNPAASAGSVRLLPIQLVLGGGFDLEWSVNVRGGRAAEWLALQPVAEHVLAPDGLARTVNATLTLILNVSEQRDFSVAGDLRSTVAIESRIPSQPGVRFEGQSIVIPVRVRVKAQVCVTLQDVQVETDASGRRSVGSDARLEDIEPKSSVIVYVRAYDCRRSPIQRPLDDYPLHVRLDGGSALAHDGHERNSDLVMAFAPTEAEPNLYRATLPQAWVNATGTVWLVVLTNATGVVDSARNVTLALVLTEKSFPVSKVVGAVVGLGLGVLLLCLVKLLRRNWETAKETLKAYMKFEFRLGVEMSTRPCNSVGRCRKPALACRFCT